MNQFTIMCSMEYIKRGGAPLEGAQEGHQLAYARARWEHFSMKELLGLTRRLARSPWTYLYWAVSAAGTTCAHLNKGLYGSPLLGAASIFATLASIALFYFQLNKLRNELAFSNRRNALGLFFSICTLRLRLLLLFLPLIGLLLWQGTFGRLASEYLIVSLAPPERKFGELVAMLPHFWLLLATLGAFYILDLAGRADVVAKGNSKASLRQIPRAIKTLILPLLAFALAQFALIFASEYFSFLDYVKLGDRITLALAAAWALEPLSYGMQMISALYLASRWKGQATASRRGRTIPAG